MKPNVHKSYHFNSNCCNLIDINKINVSKMTQYLNSNLFFTVHQILDDDAITLMSLYYLKKTRSERATFSVNMGAQTIDLAKTKIAKTNCSLAILSE